MNRSMWVWLMLAMAAVPANAEVPHWLSLDWRGDGHWSKYNFTNLRSPTEDPYEGFDGWFEGQANLWADDWLGTGRARTLGIYSSALASTTSDSLFWWQRHLEGRVGLQLFPAKLAGSDRPELAGLRLYVQAAGRLYLDKPEGAGSTDHDLKFGLDYYYEDIVNRSGSGFAQELWTDNAWYRTNFTFNDYDAFITKGRCSAGYAFAPAQATVYPYALIEWAAVPEYKNSWSSNGETMEARWWENYFRYGGGIRYYPLANVTQPGHSWARRLNIYGEYLHGSWWGDGPATGTVKNSDWRVGIAISNDGAWRQ